LATELTVFSDYRQIHVLDGDSKADPADYWSRFDNPLHSHLALAEDAVGIATGVNGYVTVTVEVTDGPPADDANAFEHVMECSLRANAGQLVVTAPTYGEDDGDRISVPGGWVRLRMSLARSPFDEQQLDEGDGLVDPAKWQRVRIQCWPAARTDAILIKGWDPGAGRHVSS
jgi:hypothetical protein